MTHLTQGIILKKEAYRENDRLYCIYTRDLGKVFAIVAGAQKPVSKLSPHLESYGVIELMLAEGNNYFRVASANLAKNFSAVSADLQKVVFASCVLEAVDLLTKDNFADPAVFGILENFLFELSLSDSREEQLFLFNRHLFEILRHLGYEPRVTATSQRQLAMDLAKTVMEAAERPMQSAGLLTKLLV